MEDTADYSFSDFRCPLPAPHSPFLVLVTSFHIFIHFVVRIGSDHNLHIFFKKNYLILVKKEVAGGKFYRLPPDEENTE